MHRPADAYQAGTSMRRHVRQAGVHWIVLGMLLNEALDDRIFERMEADHAQTPFGREHLERRVQRRAELPELVVDVNAQCLEGARCGMLARLSRRHGLRYDRGELTGRLDGRRLTRRHDRARNALRETFFAVLANDAREVVLGHPRKKLRRSHTRSEVHPHIERTIVRKTETTRGVVELR